VSRLMGRVVAAALWAVVGFLAAYLAWGPRALGLEAALQRLASDNDYLRSQLVERSNRNSDDGVRSLGAGLEQLAKQIGEQSETLRLQAASVQQLLEGRDGEMAASLESCDAAQSKMQSQLEKCLFGKAEAERAAAAAKRAAAEPRQGKQTVTETMVVPKAEDLKGMKPGPNGFVLPEAIDALRKRSMDASAAGSGAENEPEADQ